MLAWDDCSYATLETVHRPDEREWLRGVRTRNRLGRESVGVLPALLNDPKTRVRTVAERRGMFQVSDNVGHFLPE